MKHAVVLLLLLLLLPMGAFADPADASDTAWGGGTETAREQAEPTDPNTSFSEAADGLRAVLSTLDLSDWDRWMAENDPDIAFVPSEFLADAVLQGTVLTEPETLLERILQFVGTDAVSLLKKAAVCIGFGILVALTTAIRQEGNAVMPDGVVRLLGGCLVLGLSTPVLRDAAMLLDRISDGAQRLLPVLLGYFAMFDLSAGSALLNPSISLLCEGMIRSVTDAVFPLALIGGVLYALDLSGDGRLAAVGQTCLKGGQWLIGIGSSLYLAVTAVRGTVAVQSDNLLFRTAKLAAGSLPFVGNLAAGSVETMYQSVLLIRSTLGLTGILLLGAVMLRPIMRLMLERVMLKACAVLLEPLGIRAYAELLNRIGTVMGLVFAAVLVTLLMLSVTVGLITGVWQSV